MSISSKTLATLRIKSSRSGAAMICKPKGSLDERLIGKERAGKPIKEKGWVNLPKLGLIRAC
jgi:hypothetical protein